MKNRIQPSGEERLLGEHDFIVSKTDLAGRITYGNQIFIAMSGYTEAELLGAQHNIIRHPDMPRGVFKLLWNTLKEGRECFAYVKNLAKDGSHYWVLANVTPDRDERGQVCGYFSVRRKPRRDALAVIDDIYARMRAEEQQAGPREASAASLRWLENTLADKGMRYDEFILSI